MSDIIGVDFLRNMKLVGDAYFDDEVPNIVNFLLIVSRFARTMFFPLVPTLNWLSRYWISARTQNL